MTEHSRILATDFRVADDKDLVERMSKHNDDMARLGAHHLVVYRALRDPSRVFATLGLQDRRPMDELLRSPAVMEWFDAAGVDEIPPLFAGEMIDKLELADHRAEDAGVVVAAIAPVHDFTALMENVRSSLRRFIAAGVRRVWVYRAIDDGDEVMILQELDTEENALRWVEHPDAAAEWMSSAGVGVYPPLFVGKLQRILELQSLA